MKSTRVDDLHEQWLKDADYRREYESLEEEFSLTAALIDARSRAGLTQEQAARRKQAVHADFGEICQGDRQPAADQL